MCQLLLQNPKGDRKYFVGARMASVAYINAQLLECHGCKMQRMRVGCIRARTDSRRTAKPGRGVV